MTRSDIGEIEVTPARTDAAGTPDREQVKRVARSGRGGWRRSALVISLRAVTIAVLLILWQELSGPVLPRYAVSRPTSVVQALGSYLSSSAGWTDIRVTSTEVLLGFLLGTALGTVMGLVLGSFTIAGEVLEPLIAAFNGIPKIALAPLFLLFFGLGEWSKITIAITSVAFVLFYNIYLGMRLVRRELVEVLQVMGGRPRHVIVYAIVPSLAPPFFAGLKAGGPLAILSVIAGEFIASFNGVGHLLFLDSNDLNASGVFAGLIVLVVMALILNSLLNQLDRFALRKLGLNTTRGRSRR